MGTTTHRRRAILVATDFSRLATLVIPYAFKLAGLLNLPIIILHVVKASPGFEQKSPNVRRSLHSLKTKALLELGRIVRLANDNGLMADYKLLVGIPEDSILEVAHSSHVAFIVMGTHGKTGLDRLRLGSVAESTLRKAPCPILTVGASVPPHPPVNSRRLSIARFLVATDFSAASKTALRTAVELAKRLNARVLLVHVTEPSDSLQPDPLRVDELSQRRYGQQFQKIISASRGDEVITDKIVITGNPVKVILNQAKHRKTDLIIVGTRGHRGMQRLMLGSVAEAVVRSAACPVFTVRAEVRNPFKVTTGTRRSPLRHRSAGKSSLV